jgi:thioredoxin reductase
MTGSTVDVLVIGAGPYGLSTFAHLRSRGLKVRIFGETMRTWVSHMPCGMFLKSTPSASNVAAGRPGFALPDYCRTVGVSAPTGDEPVPIDLFVRYGRWFAEQLAPTVEPAEIRAVDRVNGVFRIETSEGERFDAAAVVVASGLIGHAYVPPELAGLAAGLAAGRPDDPPQVSHSSEHTDLSVFAGQEVAVVGAGQSALESAALLSEAGAKPTVVARRSPLRFADTPEPLRDGGRRFTAKPGSPLGPGWSLYACAKGPALFNRLPDRIRLDLVARILGPAGAWWLRERVIDRFPIETGQDLVRATADGDRVALHVVGPDAITRTIRTDHVLSATGYRIGADSFAFLSPNLRRALTRLHGWPRLHAGFESSVPGLYFVGFPAAASFGPLMRFVCGTAYAAPRVTEALVARAHAV